MDYSLEVLRVIACILMAEWGIIHILAGVITIPTSLKQDLAGYYSGIFNVRRPTRRSLSPAPSDAPC